MSQTTKNPFSDNWQNFFRERSGEKLPNYLSREDMIQIAEKRFGPSYVTEIVKFEAIPEWWQLIQFICPPGMDGLVRELADQALEFMPKEWQNELRDIPIGALAKSSLSSYFSKEPEGAENIFVNEKFLLFIMKICRVVVAMVEFVRIDQQIRGKDYRDDEISLLKLGGKAIQVCMEYTGWHNAEVRIFSSNLIFDYLSTVCCHGCELFIVLHEFAHILLERKVVERFECPCSNFVEDSIGLSEKEKNELYADSLASKCLLEWNGSALGLPEFVYSENWQRISPFVFWEIVKFKNAIVGKCYKENITPDSLRLIDLRRQLQLEILTDKFSKVSPFVKDAINVSNVLNKVLLPF